MLPWWVGGRLPGGQDDTDLVGRMMVIWWVGGC